jgi:Sigma-70, region 4
MSRLDDLPPDQRAVLLLLIQQGKSQAEIADMLGISPDAVRDRARAALSALADGPPVDGPAGISGASRASTRAAQGAGGSTTPRPSSPAGVSTGRTPTQLPVSRRGGALLLAALAVVVVVAVILITSGGSHKRSAATTTTTQTASTSTASASKKGTGPTVDSQFALTPTEPASKAIGFVEVLSEKGEHAFYLGAEHLPPSTGFSYVVWLYNSPTSAEALVKSPTVGSNGRLQGGALLPANAGSYSKMLLTRETSDRPTHPGPIVLSGSFSLGH